MSKLSIAKPWIMVIYHHERLKTFRTNSPTKILLDNVYSQVMLLYYIEDEKYAGQVLSMFRLLSREQKWHLIRYDWVEISKSPSVFFYGLNLLKQDLSTLPKVHIPLIEKLANYNRRPEK